MSDLSEYGPGTPWATHDWDDAVPLWQDEAWWCVSCRVASFHDGAHKPCPGVPPAVRQPMALGHLVAG